MAIELSRLLLHALQDLRCERTAKRIRAYRDGHPVVDTQAALLVWEPKRVTPVYAVPGQELVARLEPARGGVPADEYPVLLADDAPPVLDPRTAFSRHTTPGEELDLVVAGAKIPRAAFRPSEPDLDGYVVLDFSAFTWLEDQEQIFGHPRDPFHRVDIRATRRRVEVQLDGVQLADTCRAQLVYETMLPVRFYIPPGDIRMDLLEASPQRSVCPYKGRAHYWSCPASGRGREIAWAYDSSIVEARQIHGLVCFFNERADVLVDGKLLDTPVTPWS